LDKGKSKKEESKVEKKKGKNWWADTFHLCFDLHWEKKHMNKSRSRWLKQNMKKVG
jgi:hypothetical protein